MGEAVASPRARAAEWLGEVPTYIWDGRTLPVPVETIADSFCDLRVREVAPAEMPFALGGAVAEGEGLSGLLLVREGEIWVNRDEAEQWPGRKRFTVGHEVGHWVLHRPTGDVFCRAAGISGVPAEASSVPDIEEEASLFASAVLFPDALVREHFERLDGNVVALCELFGASRRATERAVLESIRRPLLTEVAGVAMFFHDDPGYEAWRAAHRKDGFILNDTFDERSRLHRASCSYLDRPVQDGVPRTRYPKWCGLDPVAPAHLVHAAPCSRCRP